MTPRGKYVLESHVVTGAPSGTVLYLLRNAPRKREASLPFLGVGNVLYSSLAAKSQERSGTRGLYDVRGAQFASLPSTLKEVKEAARIAGRKSVLLIGENATEASFKAQPLSDFKVLHLALHGVANSIFPDRAALVFGQGTDSGEDGLLQAREIGRLHLSADLVTLSACNTGIGRLEGQEGVVNLVRAFLFAGARSVVASLWAADDVFTAALMKQFYLHLAEGLDKGAALNQAKLDLLRKHRGEIVPSYWAGFTLVGEGATATVFSR